MGGGLGHVLVYEEAGGGATGACGWAVGMPVGGAWGAIRVEGDVIPRPGRRMEGRPGTGAGDGFAGMGRTALGRAPDPGPAASEAGMCAFVNEGGGEETAPVGKDDGALNDVGGDCGGSGRRWFPVGKVVTGSWLVGRVRRSLGFILVTRRVSGAGALA